MKLPRRAQNWLRRKALSFLSPLVSWWTTVQESFPGAWQQHVVVNTSSVSAYWAVWSCITLIAGDIAKLFPRVMEWNAAKQIWLETEKRPVLLKPNRYQNYIDFIFDWVRCLLLYGNTYVLKERGTQGKIVALYILDPSRVTPLVASDGGIYYRLNTDNLAGVDREVTVPQSEVIHDRIYPLFHPLIGVSPIFACSVAASQGIAIQNNSQKFFENMSRPSGMLVAPGPISEETASALKTAWDTNFGGERIGKVAVLGDGLKYESMSINAHDAQMIEQLKMTAEMVCACFKVPGYKIGVGQMPTVNNTASLNQQYYDQCLQVLIEKIEVRLTEGLELAAVQEVQFDLKGLLRMDPEARQKALNEGIKGGWLAPNEARREMMLEPVKGGETPYLQQQNYSLAALAKRDESDDPFGKQAQPAAKPADGEEEMDPEEGARFLVSLIQQRLAA
jgi:HK97 family phage portal protein